LRVGYAAASAAQLPVMVAKEEGFFEANDLDVELISIGGTPGTQALVAGQLDVFQVSAEPVQATLAGADLVYVAAPLSVLTYSLYVQPSIAGASDLKGKAIGITTPGAATNIAGKFALRSLQLDPDTDVTFVPLRTQDGIVAGLVSGQTEAGVLIVPFTLLAGQQGMRELVDVAKTGITFPAAWHAVSRGLIQRSPDVVQRYVRAIVQAIAFETRNRAETERVLGVYSQTTDEDVLDQSYDQVVPYLRRVPLPQAEAVQNALDELAPTMPAARSARPESFIEPRFVQELQDSGFVDSLYT
jgi:ABC-type nitrate/sulfonate/bicarbonate transport system substrate-binding protein